MEAVPRMPMLSLEMKNSIEYVDFGPTLKQYIRDHYGEDPAHFNKACSELEQLRQTAVHISHDFMGCSTLKKYYAQLQFLQGRFPLTEGGQAAIPFTWEDVYTGREVTLADIKFEQASILYNIGALHSILGAMDTRQSADGMKVSCTHFQCATWAFEHLRDHFGSSAMSTDMCHEILTFHNQLMLAQAQECILEKSMTDSRKSTITAKVAAQIVEFYRTTLKHLEVCHSEELMSSRRYKDCKKTLEIKILFYTCITNYYMGRDSEDQQKWGLCLAYFTLAKQKLEECMKHAKNESSDIQETLRFTNDVVFGKYAAAKKDNDFVYHDKVPALDSLPEVKGASLVKGIPFNPNDPEISGQDIFQKLVPMSAHEAASLYSEEKAKLLRKTLAEVEEKNEQLTRYLSSLQLDASRLKPEPERLPQQLLEKCAAISVRPSAIQDLIDAMGAVSNVATEVDLGIKEMKQMLAQEEEKETEFQNMFGKRTRNIVLSEIEKECDMFEEGHKKGSQSNNDLHKAMNAHINNLRLLSGPLDELQKALPSLDKEKSNEDETIIRELQRLLTKVEEMKQQRYTLEEQFRKQVHDDDITNSIVTREGVNREVLFQEHLKKHEQTTNFIHQNLSAQDNILRALTDANAKYANIRRSSGETVTRREAMIKDLIHSYDVYEDLLAKSQKGLEFYRKLENNITRLFERCQRVCKVQQEERDQVMARHKPKAPPPSRPSAPKPSSELQDQVNTIMPPSSPVSMPVFDGPKLKDYLPFMKPRTFGKKDSALDPKIQGYLPELGGSLPGSATGSPIHLPTMSGSHPGTPLLSSRRGNSLPPDLSGDAGSQMYAGMPFSSVDPPHPRQSSISQGPQGPGATCGFSGSLPISDSKGLTQYPTPIPSSNATSNNGQQQGGLEMKQYPRVVQPQSSHSPSPDSRHLPPQPREGQVPQPNVMPPTAQTQPLFMQPQNQQLPKQLPQQNMQMPQHLPANLQGQQIFSVSGQQQMYQAQPQIPQGGVVQQQGHGQGQAPAAAQGQGQGQLKSQPQQLYQQQYAPTPYTTQQDGAGQQGPQQSNFPQQYYTQTQQPPSQQFAGQPNQQLQGQPQQFPQSFAQQTSNLTQSQQPPISMSQSPQITQTQYQTPSSQSHQAYSQYQGDHTGQGSAGQPQMLQFSTVYSSQYQPYCTAAGSQFVANNAPILYSYNQHGQDTTNTVSTVSAPVISPGKDRLDQGHLSEGQFSGQLPPQSGHLQGPQFQGGPQLSLSQAQQPQSILQQHQSQPQGQGQGQQPQYQGQQFQILQQYSSSMSQGQGSQLANQNLIYNQDQPCSPPLTPVSTYQRHPLNQMLSALGSPSQALFSSQMQPVSSHQGQSVSSFESKPVPNRHAHPVSSYQVQPVSTYQAQPVSSYQTQSLPTYPTQPIASYQAQTVPSRQASQRTDSYDTGSHYGQSMGSQSTASVSASYSLPHGTSIDTYGQSSYLGAQQPVRPSQGVQVAGQPTYSHPNQESAPRQPTPGQQPMTHHGQGPFSASKVQTPQVGGGYQQQQHKQFAYQQQFTPQQQQLQQPSILQPQFQQQGMLANTAQQTPVSVAMNKPQHVSYPGQGQGFTEKTQSQQQPPEQQYAQGQHQVTQTVPVRPQQPSQQFQAQLYPHQSALYKGQGQMHSQGQQAPGVQQPMRAGVPASFSDPTDSQQIPKTSQQPPPSQWAQSQGQFPRRPASPYSTPGSLTAQPGQTSLGQQIPPQGQFLMQMQMPGQPLPQQLMGHQGQQVQHQPHLGAQQPQPLAQQGFDQTSSQEEPKLSSPLQPIQASKPPEPSPVHKPQQQTTSTESHQVSKSTVPPPSSTMSPQHAVTAQQLSKLEQQHSNASSLDEILSSSPSEKSNTKMEDVLAPKVLTAQEIEQQKEEARKNLSLPQVPIDPYKEKDKLNKFVDEVEKLAKFIENMEKPTCAGSTPLDAIWKELMDTQERANRKQPMAIARCYPMKNRDQDIMPYDDTRVVLTTQKDDYINASWINDLSPCCPKFIGTQAPLLVTMQDFWAMVYEQGIEVLIMLTSENETGKKFPVYWPQQKGLGVDYGPFTLTLQSVKDKQCWTERIIYLTHTETKVGRTIVHLLFNDWPISGSPSKISLIPQFITEVHTFYRQQCSLMKPVLVHCSNGSGRTGTFMLIYVGILEIIHGNGIFNLQEVATKILQRRRNCILKKDQIRYCYDTILYYAQDLLGKQGIFVHKASFGDKIPGPGEKPGLWTPTDDIVLGSVSLHVLQARLANLGITGKMESSKMLEEKNSSQNDLVNIKSDTSELEKIITHLPDVVQSPKHVQEKCAISNSNQDNKNSMDMLSDIGSSKSHSRTGSNTSVSSTGSQPQEWAPLQVSQISQTTVSKTLADLQNPSTFTLGTSEPGKKKITKASFNSSKSSIGESNPSDPLSSLDPLWSLHKK